MQAIGTITFTFKYVYIDRDGQKQEKLMNRTFLVHTRRPSTGGGSGGGIWSGSLEPRPKISIPEGQIGDLTVDISPWTAEKNVEESSWDRVRSVAYSSKMNQISPFAFSYLKNMSVVTLPRSITEIGFGAFSAAENLTDIYYKETEEEWNNIIICKDNAQLSEVTIHFKEILSTAPITFSPVEVIAWSDTYSWHFDIMVEQRYTNSYVYAAIYNQSHRLHAIEKVPLNLSENTYIEIEKCEQRFLC